MAGCVEGTEKRNEASVANGAEKEVKLESHRSKTPSATEVAGGFRLGPEHGTPSLDKRYSGR